MPKQYEITHGLSASDSDTISCNALSISALGDAIGAGRLSEESVTSLGCLVIEKADEILAAADRITSLKNAGPLVIHSTEEAQRIFGFIITLRQLDEVGAINPLFSREGLVEIAEYLTREARRLGIKPRGGFYDGKRRPERASDEARKKFQDTMEQATKVVKAGDDPEQIVQDVLGLFGIGWQNFIDPTDCTTEGGEA